MKFLTSFVLAFTFLTVAHAQQVETTINGEEYTCRPISESPRPSTGNPMACMDMAYAGPFSRAESETLCQGARNTGPALCAIKAYEGPFSKQDSLNLCRGARSAGPVECYLKAYAGPFSREESMQLCMNNPRASAATAECAITAYSGRYSREEALRYCNGSHKSMQKVALLSHKAFDELIIKANEKAMAEGIYKK